MKNHIRTALCVIFCVSLAWSAFSQTEEYRETNMTSYDVKVDKKKEAPEQKKLIKIIKNDTKEILYGNRCFEEVTADMGFEYVVQPKGQPGNKNEFGRNVHNFGAKFRLFFKAGPFWKSKVKKKVRECRELSGDFVG